jgi:hypothetical protein
MLDGLCWRGLNLSRSLIYRDDAGRRNILSLGTGVIPIRQFVR